VWHVTRGAIEIDETVAVEAVADVRSSMLLQVIPARVERIGDFAHATLDEVFLRERSETEGNVRLAAGQVEHPSPVDQLDLHARMRRAEARSIGAITSSPSQSRLVTRISPLSPVSRAATLPLDRKRASVHLFQAADQCQHQRRGPQPSGLAIEQLRLQAAFQRVEPTTHRWLCRAQCARGGAQGSVADDGKRDFQVIPIDRHRRICPYGFE
jgi:hypothetical protein